MSDWLDLHPTTTHENGGQTVSDERDLKSHQIMELSRAIERVTALADDYDEAAIEAEEVGASFLDPDVREYHRRVAAAGRSAARRLRAAIAGSR